MTSLGAAPCALSEPIVPEYQRRVTPPTFHLEVDLWGPLLSSDSGACGGEPGPACSDQRTSGKRQNWIHRRWSLLPGVGTGSGT